MPRSAQDDITYGSVHTGNVEAPLNYIAESSEKPVYYAYEPPPGVPRQTGQFAPRSVQIRNARAGLGELTLDNQGFQLRNHATSVINFYDRDEVQRVYYPEVEPLLKEATGASKVAIFDHQVRCLPMAQRGERGAREYGKVVHNDYTAKSGATACPRPSAASGSRGSAEASVCRDQRLAANSRTSRVLAPGCMRCTIYRARRFCTVRSDLPRQSRRNLSI
jgi:hypothetical protein